ncbi:MAG: hypothetical protein GY867_10380 [bacterium]|nr:hypothetical protein [bacterium]
MNSEKTKILSTPRSRTRFSNHRRFLTLTTHISIVFAMSLAGVLATGFFFLNYVSGDLTAFSQLLHEELLFPLIAIALGVALGAGLIVMVTLRRKEVQAAAPAPQTDPQVPTKDPSPPILRLHRNAERLNAVEHNLMVKMSHSDAVDKNARSMLAEMQMCTKRLMGGLADLEREKQQTEAKKESEWREEEHEFAAY